jgi:hypothetical protein
MFPNSPEYGTPLQNPFWANAAKKYKKIIKIPIQNKPPQWGVFADYAAQYMLGTNSVYLARASREKIENENKALSLILKTGKFNEDTLYIVDDWKNLQTDITYKKNSDLLARIDGFNVLAPNWKSCKECPPIAVDLELLKWIPSEMGLKTLFFNKDSSARDLVLAAGWSSSGEDWGTWSSANVSRLVIPLPKGSLNGLALNLNLRALIGPSHPTQNVKISFNGLTMGDFVLTHFDNNILNIRIPEEFKKQQFLVVDFESLNPISPKELGISPNDDRSLSIGLRSLKLEKIR